MCKEDVRERHWQGKGKSTAYSSNCWHRSFQLIQSTCPDPHSGCHGSQSTPSCSFTCYTSSCCYLCTFIHSWCSCSPYVIPPLSCWTLYAIWGFTSNDHVWRCSSVCPPHCTTKHVPVSTRVLCGGVPWNINGHPGCSSDDT